jgi:hypothetical protein
MRLSLQCVFAAVRLCASNCILSVFFLYLLLFICKNNICNQLVASVHSPDYFLSQIFSFSFLYLSFLRSFLSFLPHSTPFLHYFLSSLPVLSYYSPSSPPVLLLFLPLFLFLVILSLPFSPLPCFSSLSHLFSSLSFPLSQNPSPLFLSSFSPLPLFLPLFLSTLFFLIHRFKTHFNTTIVARPFFTLKPFNCILSSCSLFFSHSVLLPLS